MAERRIELANVLADKLLKEGFQMEDILSGPHGASGRLRRGLRPEAVRAIQEIRKIFPRPILSAAFPTAPSAFPTGR